MSDTSKAKLDGYFPRAKPRRPKPIPRAIPVAPPEPPAPPPVRSYGPYRYINGPRPDWYSRLL